MIKKEKVVAFQRGLEKYYDSDEPDEPATKRYVVSIIGKLIYELFGEMFEDNKPIETVLTDTVSNHIKCPHCGELYDAMIYATGNLSQRVCDKCKKDMNGNF
ncbi:MAG: hypothetical protein WC373_00825 [Smithella sp.]